MEYAQLNHDADHHSDHSVQDDHADETDNTADHGECKHDPVPDCWLTHKNIYSLIYPVFVLKDSPKQLCTICIFETLYKEHPTL